MDEPAGSSANKRNSGEKHSEPPLRANKTPPRDGPPMIVTEGMIRLRRQFDFASRSRPNAIAIINPETKEVLFPGKISADKKDEDNKDSFSPNGPANDGNVSKMEPSMVQQFVQMQSPVHQGTFAMDPNYDPFHPFYVHYDYPVTYHELPSYEHRSFP